MADAYAILLIDKVKSPGRLVLKYEHNLRLRDDIPNIIPDKIDENETLIPLPRVSGKELNYAEAFRKRIGELTYYKDHKVRKNAVLAYEVVLKFSNVPSVNIDIWKEKSIEWLKEKFNIAPDGGDNVINAILHMDEVGGPHIHAIVIPIDPRGHLNATYFTDGRKAMSNLQTSYAEAVKDAGLERGLQGSSATHISIRRMYASNKEIQNIPEPNEGETAIEFRDRVLENLQTICAAKRRKADDYEVEKRRKADKYYIEKTKAARDDLENIKSENQRVVSLYKEKISEQKKEIGENFKEIEEQMNALEGLAEIEDMPVEDIINILGAYQVWKLGLKTLEEQNPDEYYELDCEIQYVMNCCEDPYEENAEEYDDEAYDEEAYDESDGEEDEEDDDLSL